jgi:cytidylate kinase
MNLNENFVITISRDIGSGGRTVGRILAEKLNTRFCDKTLIEALEKKFDLTAQRIEELKGKKDNWLASLMRNVSPVPSAKALGVAEEPYPEVTADEIYKAESAILKELAEEGSCVITGRSGFHIFRDHPNHLSVYITASPAFRLQRVMRKQGLSKEEAGTLIQKIDKARENYIQRHTGTSRYNARNYDLVLKADGHTEEQLADIILKYLA